MAGPNIQNIIQSLKGVTSQAGGFAHYVKTLKDELGIYTNEPGDFVIANKGDEGTNVVVTAPIAYDLWYLRNSAVDHRGSGEYNDDGEEMELWETTPATKYNAAELIMLAGADPATYPATRMAFLSEKLGDTRLFRGIRNPEDLIEEEGEPFWSQVTGNDHRWINAGQYFIHLMAFENWTKGSGYRFTSNGPDGANMSDYCGYFAFPVSQLGVMEILSILFETDTEVTDFELDEDERPAIEEPAPMFPPRQRQDGSDYFWNERCFGKHLTERAYVVVEAEKPHIEYLEVTHIPEQNYHADIKPKGWLRYWVKKDNKFWVPGEFIGLLCKALPIPPHVWWFQESNPFVYAGHWAETAYLTSGAITAITEETDRTDDGIGKQYTVKVHGVELTINASDFYGFEVGDRVGVLKHDGIYDWYGLAEVDGDLVMGWWPQSRNSYSFDEEWLVKDDKVTRKKQKEEKTIWDHDYMIIPIEFYKEEEE